MFSYMFKTKTLLEFIKASLASPVILHANTHDGILLIFLKINVQVQAIISMIELSFLAFMFKKNLGKIYF